MLHAVIMAGGSGTRFWPMSRRSRPKQLLRLVGDETMIQATAHRMGPLAGPGRTWVITGQDQVEAVRAQLPELPAEQIVAEPSPRDTAACVGVAATIVAAADSSAIMIVLPADHVIRPEDAFHRSVHAAVQTIEQDPEALVTFGIPPTRPETGYGYIERGAALGEPEGLPLFKVRRFHEKPNRETAQHYLETGQFAWNSGIFVWRAATILDNLARYQPELAEGLKRIGAAWSGPDRDRILHAVFPSLPRMPIDRAVLEHSPHVRMIEAPYEWSDVGDWRALAELLGRDSRGNVKQGSCLLVDTRNTTVITEGPGTVATLGVDDLVVIQSGGVTLVARRDQLDDLKLLVESLDQAGFPELK
jgi:mannose-1-phosphate guanylyltransferase